MPLFRDEISHLFAWERHHKLLLFRIALVFAATAVVDLFGTIALYFLERNARGTEVHSFGGALFFTTVQLLTVSSQLKNPVTAAGRVVDVVLEFWAVLVVAGSAGAIAAFFHTSDAGSG